MLETIARIVQAAREREQVSLDQLADRTGVALATLEALERAQAGITTTQLFEVARLLSLDPAALLAGRETIRHTPSVFLRHSVHQDWTDEDTSVLDDALEAGRALAGLQAQLGEPRAALQAGIFVPELAAADRAESPAKAGYRLAGRVRQWMQNAKASLGDMRSLIERDFGIAVVVRALATARSTAASVRAGDRAAIVLNARDVHRQTNPLLARNHQAHELCHILFDPSDGGVHVVIDTASDKKTHAAEQRARAFAAELLLPLSGLVDLLGDPRGVMTWDAALALVSKARSHFGTSHEIASNHLCNLGFIDLRLRDQLEATTSTYSGAVPVVELPGDGGPSICVADYVQRAHDEGLLTDGEAKGMLGMDRLSPLPWDEVTL